MLFRHGDVLVASIKDKELPSGARLQPHTTLAKGEITGHSHRVAEPNAAELWQHSGLLFLKVIAEQATLIHEEHKAIVLPKGSYRVWIQREYTPAEICNES